MRIQTLPSLLILLVISPLAFANSNSNSSTSTSPLDFESFPLMPRITALGITGSHSVGLLDIENLEYLVKLQNTLRELKEKGEELINLLEFPQEQGQKLFGQSPSEIPRYN